MVTLPFAGGRCCARLAEVAPHDRFSSFLVSIVYVMQRQRVYCSRATGGLSISQSPVGTLTVNGLVEN